MVGGNLNLWIAFIGGIVSFISPCVLPLYPSYLSYITGISVDQLKNDFDQKNIRRRTLLHTLFFSFGFSIIFISLGYSASLIGDLFYQFQDIVRKIGAVLMIFMGLFLGGWLKWNWLMKERRMEIKSQPSGYLGSVFIGISFAAGWTPCVGPILTLILALAATDPSKGMLYLLVYSIGFAIPFFIMAFFIGSTKWIVRYSEKVMKVSGVLLVLIGLLLFTNQMAKITVYLTKWFGTSWF
ncbi:cytochrome c biogenesis CcdA family protein [Tepidibacillus fermentans]|uniref:Cytochrome c-type biogenesis protein n=1 Tax=Tepidibacillus fermentans TaxID=1281767 RepID=A0A4R3KJQ8_9BACI|nr:cytochrome c biogenesis protein CcdA [Tepidibacillus fermentans]TCS84011.1 cytochrome c-type biogenesis protein [Tepidibacillus fermentans]